MDARSASPPDAPDAAILRADAIERLSDGFSHDTRNPLNAVVIHLEVLADKLRRENGGAVPHGLERNLKAIRDQVGRLDEMVRRFVELAAPHRQTEPDFDVAELVRAVAEQCTHPSRLGRAEVRAEAPPGLRALGSVSELGVALVLAVLAELDAGAKQLTLRAQAEGALALVTLEGTVPGADPNLHALQAAAARPGCELRVEAGAVRLRIPTARHEPALRVVADEAAPRDPPEPR